jgi:uncharacterized protein with beta-barrel porin domain
MKLSCRRLALFGASVSVVALAIGSPAHAATDVSSDPVDDKLTICLIDDDCLFSVEAHDSIVNDGPVSFVADVAAVASGSAWASAMVTQGFAQFVSAGANETAALDFTNHGTVHAAASALASGSMAYALASDGFTVRQNAANFGGGAVSVSLSNDGEIDAGAIAHANAQGPTALASATNYSAVDQRGYAFGNDAFVALSNSGAIHVGALAAANIAVSSSLAAAIAFASNDDAIAQSAGAYHGDASVSLVNSGEVNVDAAAHAVANGGYATATAYLHEGIYQEAFAVGGDARVHIDNGDILGLAASAQATGAAAFALAGVHSAVSQFAAATSAGNASADFANSGKIDISAIAVAHATNSFGAAEASLTSALFQLAYAPDGEAQAALTNSGAINAQVNATATALVNPLALALRGPVIKQEAIGGSLADIQFDNVGKLSFEVAANANGGRAIAIAGMAAASQLVSSSDIEKISFTNRGTIAVGLAAKAVGTSAGFARAGGRVLYQEAVDGTASFANSGIVDIYVAAQGVAPWLGHGSALATGVAQLARVADFDNSGILSVNAAARGSGTGSGAFVGVRGFARGYGVFGSDFSLDSKNSGTIDVSAAALSPLVAYAGAVGMAFTAFGSGTSAPDARIDGTVVNSGRIEAAALAHGTPIVWGSGSTASSSPGSSATAIGLAFNSQANAASVTNSGAINVDAVTLNGGPANATGVRVHAFGLPAGTPDSFTLTNDGGSIRARQSTDGGQTWHRGIAIDVATAPNASVINFLAGGRIYGNIDVQAGDTINVTGGETLLDGIINPECVGASDPNGCGQGALNINNGGALVLEDRRFSGVAAMYDGPSHAFLNSLDLRAASSGSAGTLALGLEPAAGGVQAAGMYTQLFADTANLAGTLEARLATKDGLFEDSYSWDNVVDANTLNGRFDRCIIGGNYANSALLNFSCSYDNAGNVDLALTRVAFDAVAGLNRNATSVGSAIEDIYNTGLTGGVANLVSDLFRTGDAAGYSRALNMLSGSSYANYLQSFGSLGVHANDLVDRATDCDKTVRASASECRSGPVRLWGQVDDQKRNADADVEAGAIRSNRWTTLLGADVGLGRSAVLGLTFGGVANHVRDKQFGDDVKSNGYAFGLFGVYDPGAFYVKGMAGYSAFQGHSSRRVDLTTFAGSLSGDPDVNMWTLGFHAGYRRQAGKSLLTSYVNLDYADARLDGFSEARTAGDPGAELSISGGKSRHVFLTSGLKWTGRIGGLVPELDLGYRYRFDDRRSQFSASGIGGEDAGFDIVSASQKRGSLLAGVSVGGKLAWLDLRLSYEGEYSGNAANHSASLKISLPLGGKARPAPQ